jgi:hypothetical protein
MGKEDDVAEASFGIDKTLVNRLQPLLYHMIQPKAFSQAS